MNTLRVKNFRSIEDSGVIKLKPISVFLGKNSCGKSSFIRLFPLLKQTLEEEGREPFLWYGDYVDFGEFDNILPKNSTNKEFEIFFNMDIIKNFKYFYGKQDDIVNVEVGMKINRKNIRELSLSFYDQKIKILFSDNNQILELNINEELYSSKNEFIWKKHKNNMLPFVYGKNTDNHLTDNYMHYYYYMLFKKEQSTFVETEALNVLSQITSNRTKDQTKLRLFTNMIALQSKEELLKKFIAQKSLISVNQFFSNKNVEDKLFLKLNNLIIYQLLNLIIGSINDELRDLFKNTFYLKPIRVNAERYYRIQGVNISNVDADGTNLPMVFYNMEIKTKTAFEKWCLSKFGLRFSVETKEGHVSLIVQDKYGNKNNLVDTGYGYSQILPIIMQLWLLKNNVESNKSFVNKDIMLIVEQPELHLHPAFQVKIIDVFASLIREMEKAGINLKIIFETHSSTMINRLGYLVSKKEFDENSINIVLVEKEKQISQFKQVQYNEEGLIEEWPIGFMTEDN